MTPFRVFIVANPRDKFTAGEYESMKRYIDNGGSILLTLNEGGEGRQMTNVNTFLKQYGVQVNEGPSIESNLNRERKKLRNFFVFRQCHSCSVLQILLS